MSSIKPFLLFVMILINLIFNGFPASAEENAAKIILFQPASGALKPGQTAISNVIIKNTGRLPDTFFIGCSLQDSQKSWHDLPPAGPIKLAPQAISEKISFSWKIPEDDPAFFGHYKVVTAVWNSSPGPGAIKYDNAVRDKAFFVEGAIKQSVYKMNGISFYPVTHLKSIPNRNRGIIKAKNVDYCDNIFHLKFFKNNFNGSQIETEDAFSYGTYKAAIKTIAGLKSVTGFFLFSPETEDEITIEIFNDTSKKIWMTSYIAGGEPKAKLEYTLEFDPADEFHEYKIDYRQESITFFIDNKLIGKIENDSFQKIPAGSKMKLIANAWFPGWKELKPFSDKDRPGKDYEVLIKKIEILQLK